MTRLKIFTFSMKYRTEFPEGLERPNFVFDCRSLLNPGRVPEIKAFTGMDQPVIEFLQAQDDASAFFENVKSILGPTLTAFQDKQYEDLVIGFACTGGRHRSVFMAELTADFLAGDYGERVTPRHLELDPETCCVPDH